MTNQIIFPLQNIESKDKNTVGNKAWYLARLERSGFDVPETLVISRDAYTIHKKNRVNDIKIETSPKLWEQLKEEITQTLNLDQGIAVRSSSPAEDRVNKSMAGQFLTLLRIFNRSKLQDAIEKCWQSAYKTGLKQMEDVMKDLRVAVILQDMIEADLSGVAFSRSPLTVEEDVIIIEFCHGTAEHLVSGKIIPSRVIIEGHSFSQTFSSVTISQIDIGILQKVAKLAREVEQLLDFPVDMEWVVKNGRIYILQARPITYRVAEKPHRNNIPGGTWTRHLAEDLWADILTPFEEGLLISLAPRFDLRRWSRFVGLNISEKIQSIISIQNNLYVNCDALKQAISMLPNFLRTERIISLFPPEMHPRAFPHPTCFKIIRMLLGALALGLTRLQANPFTCSWVIRRRANKLANKARTLYCKDLTHLPIEALNLHLRKCTELLGRILETNQFPYFYATVFSWMVEYVGRNSCLLRESWLSKLSGTSNNATSRMISMMSNLGQALIESGIVVEGKAFDDVLSELKDGGYEVALLKAEDVLREYGVRSSQRSLVEPRWRETPLYILLYAMKIAHSNNINNEHHPQSIQPKTELLLRILLRFANNFLDLREDLRYYLDSVLFGIRATLLQIGKRTQLGDSVFFLYPKEVDSLVTGKLSLESARHKAMERSVDFPATNSPPTYWVNGMDVSPLVKVESGSYLRGIGASPGVVCGRVMIIERVEEVDQIEVGDIIIARLMGPAWAPILSFAGAVITEKGGLLDHFAILAREAGIPAVTSVENATKTLARIDRITVDGSNGIVYW